MRKLIRVIPVRDSHGDELQVYEIREAERRRFLGLGYTRKITRLKLDCGTQVVVADKDTFEIRETGERLTRAT